MWDSIMLVHRANTRQLLLCAAVLCLSIAIKLDSSACQGLHLKIPSGHEAMHMYITLPVCGNIGLFYFLKSFLLCQDAALLLASAELTKRYCMPCGTFKINLNLKKAIDA